MWTIKKTPRNHESGFVLLTVVTLTWILFFLTTSYLNIMHSEKFSVFSLEKSMKAEYIAEAGIEEAMWEYNYGGADFTGWIPAGTTRSKLTTAFTDASGTTIGSYSITVTNYNTSDPTITAVGTYTIGSTSNSATIVANLKPRAPFNGAMLSKDVVTFSGNGFTDSYDSSLGAYNAALGGGVFNVGSEGHVKTIKTSTTNAIQLTAANGSPAIAGDAGVGAGSTISHTSKISGTAYYNVNDEIADVPLPTPANDPSLPVDLTLLPSEGDLDDDVPAIPGLFGSHKYDSINLAGGDTVHVTGNTYLYVTGNIDIGGSANMNLASGASLIIYVEGNIDFGGGGLTNANGTQYPNTLTIKGRSTCTSATLRGTTDLIATINAPYANMTLTGTSGYYGALVGNQITASGGGGVHYDINIPTNTATGKEIEWIRRTS